MKLSCTIRVQGQMKLEHEPEQFVLVSYIIYNWKKIRYIFKPVTRKSWAEKTEYFFLPHFVHYATQTNFLCNTEKGAGNINNLNREYFLEI